MTCPGTTGFMRTGYSHRVCAPGLASEEYLTFSILAALPKAGVKWLQCAKVRGGKEQATCFSVCLETLFCTKDGHAFKQWPIRGSIESMFRGWLGD